MPCLVSAPYLGDDKHLNLAKVDHIEYGDSQGHDCLLTSEGGPAVSSPVMVRRGRVIQVFALSKTPWPLKTSRSCWASSRLPVSHLGSTIFKTEDVNDSDIGLIRTV